MENKAVKYLLGVALLAIWGLLGYRVVQKMTTGNDFYIPPPAQITAERIEKDSFTLLVNYRDPFLGNRINVPKKAAPTSTPVNTAPKKPEKPAKPIVFPTLIYKGKIALKTGRTAALVTIDGKTLNWGWGELQKEMTLTNIYEDSIRVRYKNEEKTIVKGGAPQ